MPDRPCDHFSQSGNVPSDPCATSDSSRPVYVSPIYRITVRQLRTPCSRHCRHRIGNQASRGYLRGAFLVITVKVVPLYVLRVRYVRDANHGDLAHTLHCFPDIVVVCLFLNESRWLSNYAYVLASRPHTCCENSPCCVRILLASPTSFSDAIEAVMCTLRVAGFK